MSLQLMTKTNKNNKIPIETSGQIKGLLFSHYTETGQQRSLINLRRKPCYSPAVDCHVVTDDLDDDVKYKPAKSPLKMVANTGVCVLLLMAARGLNSTPSLPMAYSTLGRGNMAPSRLVQRAKIAPMETIHLMTGKLASLNTWGKGASASWKEMKES